MENLPIGRLFLLLSITLVGLGARRVQEQSPNQAAIEATVLDLEEALNAAVDELDCDAVLQLSGQRAPLFVGSGDVVGTSAEFHQLCVQMVAPRTGSEWDLVNRTVNVLSPEVAYVVREGDYTIHFREQESVTVYLAMTTLWHRGEDGWRMVHLHESVRS